jgi:carboxylesterase type B
MLSSFRIFSVRSATLCFCCLGILTFLLNACSNDSNTASSSSEPIACDTEEILTTSGPVCGKIVVADNKEVFAFLGIPYAETTGGDNRWRDPIPKSASTETIQATAFGPACPQEVNPPYSHPGEFCEDCLTLNIWRRVDSAEGEPRPVMVWIYGGSFLSGGSSMPIYDGAWLAASQDVVVVSFNYRLGALGFLAGIHDLNGNYGLKDQQLAFQWTKENISHFGGNPDQITVFGESAGAMSVGLHILSIPSSQDLFLNGILQSNPFGIPYKTASEASTEAHILEGLLGCTGRGMDCMRSADVDEVVSAQSNAAIQMASLLGLRLAGFLVWSPVIDGQFVVEDPTIAAENSEFAKPAILGTNHDEGILFVNEIASAFGGEISATAYTYLLNLFFGSDNADAIIALYGIDPNGDNAVYLERIITDYLFGCANRFVSDRAVSDVWAYEFNETSINVWPDIAACDGKACHGDDLPFTFHTDRELGFQFTEAQKKLSNEMMAYWSTFAGRSIPDAAGLPAWPAYSEADRNYMILKTPELNTAVDPIPNCGFWDQIGYDLRPPSANAIRQVLEELKR